MWYLVKRGGVLDMIFLENPYQLNKDFDIIKDYRGNLVCDSDRTLLWMWYNNIIEEHYYYKELFADYID